MILETTIGDMLHDLAAMVSRAKNAWQQGDLQRLLDSLEQIALQAPQITDAVFATTDSPATGEE